MAALFICLPVLAPTIGQAESGSATKMWGTGSGSSNNSDWRNSAEFHQLGGLSAGQVNAAREGVLYSGPNMTVVGSQTIVQTSGNNNVVRDIDQSAVNSGDQNLESNN